MVAAEIVSCDMKITIEGYKQVCQNSNCLLQIGNDRKTTLIDWANCICEHHYARAITSLLLMQLFPNHTQKHVITYVFWLLQQQLHF